MIEQEDCITKEPRASISSFSSIYTSNSKSSSSSTTTSTSKYTNINKNAYTSLPTPKTAFLTSSSYTNDQFIAPVIEKGFTINELLVQNSALSLEQETPQRLSTAAAAAAAAVSSSRETHRRATLEHKKAPAPLSSTLKHQPSLNLNIPPNHNEKIDHLAQPSITAVLLDDSNPFQEPLPISSTYSAAEKSFHEPNTSLCIKSSPERPSSTSSSVVSKNSSHATESSHVSMRGGYAVDHKSKFKYERRRVASAKTSKEEELEIARLESGGTKVRRKPTAEVVASAEASERERITAIHNMKLIGVRGGELKLNPSSFKVHRIFYESLIYIIHQSIGWILSQASLQSF